MLPIDGDLIREIMPRFSGEKRVRQEQIVQAISGTLRSTLAEYKIDNTLRIAHFIAQLAHESAGFRTTEEFASGEQYEGRQDLGNTQPGDGVRYKGRGLIQLTGRANYRTYGERMGIDLEDEPLRAADPETSLVIACEYWTHSRRGGINPMADRDDLIAVTRAINGGTNGLDDRRRYLTKAKTAVARIAGFLVGADIAADARPVLRRGSRSDLVAVLQSLLSKHGFPLAIDGDFGPATETVVRLFQSNHGLVPDGIVGAGTWSKLDELEGDSDDD